MELLNGKSINNLYVFQNKQLDLQWMSKVRPLRMTCLTQQTLAKAATTLQAPHP